MTIEFIEGRYFAAIWFVGPGATPDGRDVDVHGALWRDPGGVWTLQYRFRYYVDKKTQGSEDDKSWYLGELRSMKDEDDGVAQITRAFEQMATVIGCRPEEVEVLRPRTDRMADVFVLLSKQTWAHVQATSPGGDA